MQGLGNHTDRIGVSAPLPAQQTAGERDAEKGRIVLDEEPVNWMAAVLKTIPFRQAVINHEIAMQSRIFELPHQDSADRFIAASALVYELTLITSDKKLIQAAGGYAVLEN